MANVAIKPRIIKIPIAETMKAAVPIPIKVDFLEFICKMCSPRYLMRWSDLQGTASIANSC